jgi:hypothetical protein
MSAAYNHSWLKNIHIIKDAKTWKKQGIIGEDQFRAITEEYKSSFYHPNLMIRILLFIASTIGLSGVTGILGLLFQDALESQVTVAVLSLIYGIVSFVILDQVLISKNNHYKSGISEAVLYHSILFTILGICAFTDFDNVHVNVLICLVVFAFAAYRYLDLISTACAVAALAFLIFFELQNAGGVFEQIIPIVFIVLFTPLYFFIRKLRTALSSEPWGHCLILVEAMTLLLIYAAGNYFVVRELSMELMDLYLEEGQDIPFAFLFYALTVIIPVLYLYFGIKRKDIVLIRVSLVAIAFSVFTFKYYFSMNRPEFSLTAAGVVLLGITLYIFRYLKTPRHGYTRENLLEEKWANSNAEGFIISQTLGGNAVAPEGATEGGGGGSFSGGGSTDSF